MQILMLNGCLPYPPHAGALVRIYELLRFLCQRHEVTFVSFLFDRREGRHADALARCGARVVTVPWQPAESPADGARPQMVETFRRAEMADCLRWLSSERRFDVAIVEHAWMAEYADLIEAPAVLHEHNIESEVLERYAWEAARPGGSAATRRGWPLASPSFEQAAAEALLMAAHEDAHWPRLPARVVVSERDRAAMLRRCPTGRVLVVPNGVDTRSLLPVADPSTPGILFTGSFDYQPNLDAAAELCAEILPDVRRQIPEARLTLVGKNPPPLLLLERWASGAEVVADAPDLSPWAARCSVSAAPIRTGGGSRLKILTALALGLPVVSTGLGSEGLDLDEGEGILIADEADAFADALVRLLRDRSLRDRLARAGRAAVEERYDWQTLWPAFERLLVEVATGCQTAVPRAPSFGPSR